jgi:hypothetical protein
MFTSKHGMIANLHENITFASPLDGGYSRIGVVVQPDILFRNKVPFSGTTWKLPEGDG